MTGVISLRLRSILLAASINVLACQVALRPAYSQTSRLTGIVETVDGKPLRHAEIRVVGVTTSLTTDSGEFQITLPENFKPGTPIVIEIRKWIVFDPYDGGSGRTYVHRDSSEPIKVLVAHRGDPALLTNGNVIQQIVSEVLSQTGNGNRRLVSEDTFLSQRAEELGFTVDQLKKAINTWAEKVESPYQRGLSALYQRRYLDADKLLGESINASQTDLVEKFLINALVANELGHYREAESLLKKAQTLDPANREVRLHLAGVLTDQGEFAEAKLLFLGLLEKDENRSHSLRSESLETASVLNDLAQVEYYMGNFKSAREHFGQALSLAKNLVGPEHPAIAAIIGNMAELDRQEGRFTEAEQEYREALNLNEKNFGLVHAEVAADLEGLASLYFELGKYDVAGPLAERALNITQSLSVEDHPRMARELNSIGAIRLGQRRYLEAETLFRQALKINEETLGPMHPRVATTLNNLAMSVEDKGNTAEAEALWKRAIEIDQKSLGPEHPTVANHMNSLALLYWKSGRLTDAEALSKRALTIDEDTFGPDHFSVATDLNTLALIIEDQGRIAEAEQLYLRSLRILEKSFGDSDYRVATTEDNLSHALRALGKIKEAELHDLTVRVHSADLSEPLISSSEIEIELGNDRRLEPLNSHGEANFKGIPTKFRGAEIRLLARVEGYRLEWHQEKLAANYIDYAIERAPKPSTHLAGSIVPVPLKWQSIRITVEGQGSECGIDPLGRFNLPLGG